MEPIVSPWLVYVLGIIDDVKLVIVVAAIIVTGVMLSLGVVWFMELESYKSNKDELEQRKKMCIKTLVIAICVWLLSIFIPTRNTLIGMLVAENITYSRVDRTIQTGKQLHQTIKRDILDLIDKLNHKEEDKHNGSKK